MENNTFLKLFGSLMTVSTNDQHKAMSEEERDSYWKSVLGKFPKGFWNLGYDQYLQKMNFDALIAGISEVYTSCSERKLAWYAVFSKINFKRFDETARVSQNIPLSFDDITRLMDLVEGSRNDEALADFTSVYFYWKEKYDDQTNKIAKQAPVYLKSN